MAIGQFSELKTAIANWLERGDLTSRIPEFVQLAEDRIGRELRVRAMEASINIVLKKVTSVTASEVGGSANTITFTPATAATSYTVGDNYSFTAEANNTSAVTINVSSLGAKNVKKGDASDALVADDIVNGQPVSVYYDGTNLRLTDSAGAVPLPARFLGLRRAYIDAENAEKIKYYSPEDFFTRRFTDQTARPKAFTIEGDNIVFAPLSDAGYTVRMLYWKKFAALSADGDTNWLFSNARGLLLYGALLEASPYLEDDARTLTWAAMYDDLMEKTHKADHLDRFPPGGLAVRTDVIGP